MKNFSVYLIVIIAPFASAWGVAFPSQPPPMPLSQYGQIQNVQNYSSNPFWNPNSPYNQRMPVPVYVQGTDLNAGECQMITNSLVAAQCASRDNCRDTRLGDVRPAIMLQLSQMQGHNYVGACAGFIDTAFKDYVTAYGNTVQNTGFPTAIAPGNNKPQPEFKIENPYEIQQQRFYNDEWQQEIKDREKELERLQAQNGSGNEKLIKSVMPTTIADLSFIERRDNTKAGYEEWAPVYSTNAKGERICIKNCTYQNLNIESDEKFLTREMEKQRQLAEMQMSKDRMLLTNEQFCKNYPNDGTCAAAQAAAAQLAAASGATNTSTPDKPNKIDAIIKALGQVIPK